MAEVDLKTKLTVAPVITKITATADKKIYLSWTSVPLAEKYDVKRSLTPDGEYAHVDWATDTCFTDENIEVDTTYWYKIVAWKRMEAKKTSKKASTVKMVVASDIPSVQELTVTASKGDILLSWKAIEGCKYNIYRRSDCFSRPFYIGESKTNFFTDDKLVSGQIYHYLIQTVRPSSERALLGNFTEECACAFVDATEIASAKKIWGRAVIDVNVVAGADGYIFERSDSKDGGFTEVGRTTDITAISFEEKLPSRLKTYYYRARAYKKSADKEFYGQYSSVKAVR